MDFPDTTLADCVLKTPSLPWSSSGLIPCISLAFRIFRSGHHIITTRSLGHALIAETASPVEMLVAAAVTALVKETDIW